MSADYTPYNIDTKTISDALPSALVLLDKDEKIGLINSVMEELLLRSERGVIGKGVVSIFGENSQLVKVISKAREIKANIRQKIGSGEISVNQVGEMGDLVVVVTMGGNLTAKNINPKIPNAFRWLEIERLLREYSVTSPVSKGLNAMREVLAHELRNPLAGIRGIAQLLEKKGEDKELTGLMIKEVKRMSELLDNFDSFDSALSFELVPLNLHQISDEVIAIMLASISTKSSGLKSKGINIVKDYDPSLPQVIADKNGLIQVIQNLLRNAIIAAPSGGAITVATKYIYADTENVNGVIELSVIDNGAGVAEYLRDHLFQPFVRGERGGKGLGLALCAFLIESMGGVIGFDSKPGNCKFWIKLSAQM